jgi:hypothetical protein
VSSYSYELGFSGISLLNALPGANGMWYHVSLEEKSGGVSCDMPQGKEK